MEKETLKCPFRVTLKLIIVVDLSKNLQTKREKFNLILRLVYGLTLCLPVTRLAASSPLMILRCYTAFACATRRSTTVCHVKYLHVPLRTEMRSVPKGYKVRIVTECLNTRKSLPGRRLYLETCGVTHCKYAWYRSCKRNFIFIERALWRKNTSENSIRPSIAEEIESFPDNDNYQSEMKFPVNEQETIRFRAVKREAGADPFVFFASMKRAIGFIYADSVCARTGLFLETWLSRNLSRLLYADRWGWILSYILFEAHARQIGFSNCDYGSSDPTNLFGMIGTYTFAEIYISLRK